MRKNEHLISTGELYCSQSNETCYTNCTVTVKFLNFRMPENYGVICLKFNKREAKPQCISSKRC